MYQTFCKSGKIQRCVQTPVWTSAKVRCCVFRPAKGSYHLFSISTFLVTNVKAQEKKHKKEKNGWKRGQPALRCYSQMLADTQKLVDSWGKYDFLNLIWQSLPVACSKKKWIISLLLLFEEKATKRAEKLQRRLLIIACFSCWFKQEILRCELLSGSALLSVMGKELVKNVNI